MRRCQNCGTENEDAMSFCGQCGTPLPAPANFSWRPSDEPTESFRGDQFGRPPLPPETPTFDRGPVAAAPQPKSNKNLYLILGGIASLLALVFVAAIGLVGYGVLKAMKNAPSPTPVFVANRSISGPSPSATPEEADTTPAVSFTPPLAPTKKGSFTVSGYLGWQLSPIDVVASEQFRTSAEGKVGLSKVEMFVTPAGTTDEKAKSRRLYEDYPAGALLMRTRYPDGRVSNIQPVTASPSLGLWQNAPDELGKIEFCVNDNEPALNTGNFFVTVTMLSAPKKK